MSREIKFDGLPDRDLLSLVIGKQAARRLYSGSFTALFDEWAEESKHHVRLFAARELIKRALEETLRDGPVLSSPNAVQDYLRIHFMGQEHESFVVLFLDSRNCLIAAEDLFRGTVDQTVVFPREVVKRVLYWNAVAIVVAHNHPSGSAELSVMDRFLTQTLDEVLGLVKVRVLDHFVIAGNSVFSLAALAERSSESNKD